MKNGFTFLYLCFTFISGITAQQFEFDSINFKQMEIGQVILKADTWVIRVDRGASSEYYMPINLPDSYKNSGRDVVFEGAIGRIPVNVRLAGTPIKLSMIRVLYKTKPKEGNGESIVTDSNSDLTSGFDSVGYIKNGYGKIILIGDVYLIEQNDDGEIKRLVPDFLPEGFKRENTEITFSAVVGKIPPNVRMMGTPVHIKELMMIESIDFDATKIQAPLKQYYPFEPAGYLEPVKGTIKKSESDVYFIATDNGRNAITNYLPVILPDEFKKDGLAIIVSGSIGKIPENSQLIGVPLTIDEIKLMD